MPHYNLMQLEKQAVLEAMDGNEPTRCTCDPDWDCPVHGLTGVGPWYDVCHGEFSVRWLAFDAEYNRTLEAIQSSDAPSDVRWSAANDLLGYRNDVKNQALAILRGIRKTDSSAIPF